MIFLDEVRWSQFRRKRYTRRTEHKIKELRKAKEYKQAEELEREMERELPLWHQHIQALRTTKLLEQAERWCVPLPKDRDGNKVWRQTEEDSSSYLISEAQSELRKAIRLEQRESLEHRMRWVKDVIVPILSALSVIGSLIVAYTALHVKH